MSPQFCLIKNEFGNMEYTRKIIFLGKAVQIFWKINPFSLDSIIIYEATFNIYEATHKQDNSLQTHNAYLSLAFFAVL